MDPNSQQEDVPKMMASTVEQAEPQQADTPKKLVGMGSRSDPDQKGSSLIDSNSASSSPEKSGSAAAGGKTPDKKKSPTGKVKSATLAGQNSAYLKAKALEECIDGKLVEGSSDENGVAVFSCEQGVNHAGFFKAQNFIIIILLILLCCCCRFCSKKRKKKRERQRGQNMESQPLNNPPVSSQNKDGKPLNRIPEVSEHSGSHNTLNANNQIINSGSATQSQSHSHVHSQSHTTTNIVQTSSTSNVRRTENPNPSAYGSGRNRQLSGSSQKSDSSGAHLLAGVSKKDSGKSDRPETMLEKITREQRERLASAKKEEEVNPSLETEIVLQKPVENQSTASSSKSSSNSSLRVESCVFL